MSKLLAGDKAPQFEAQTYEGQVIRLADFTGAKTVVLYFYPKDNTPGCTKEACSMRDAMDGLTELGIQVLGVSTDSVATHQKFRDKHSLNFPLLSDKSKKLVKAYDVQSAFGTASRKSFLIDKNGVIRHIWNKVKTSDHANEVMEKVKELGL